MSILKVPYINLKEQHRLLRKDILSSVNRVLKNCDFVLGEDVRKLEERFAKYCGTRFAVGVNSGTDALFLAMKAAGVCPGDEVITAPNSFLASASAIVAIGAKPVFVDVGEDMNIDPAKVKAKITSRTKAIVPVHLTGRVADMDPILSAAKEWGIAVIEDAAQAIGAEYKGKRAGSFGLANAFSLHPLKTLNALGDGGMITTDNENIHSLLLQLRNIGLKDRVRSDVWGFNSRLDTLQAAFVASKFSKVDAWIAKRRKNADFYRKRLTDVVVCPRERSYEKHAYHLFVIQVEKRDALQEYLSKKGIETKIHYPIPIHLQKCAEGLGYKEGDFPNTERQSRRILSLPIHQYLSQKQLQYTADAILAFYP